MKLTYTFYLTQYIQKWSFQHAINIKIINEIFYILFLGDCLWNPVCILHSQHTSMKTSTILGTQ